MRSFRLKEINKIYYKRGWPVKIESLRGETTESPLKRIEIEHENIPLTLQVPEEIEELTLKPIPPKNSIDYEVRYSTGTVRGNLELPVIPKSAEEAVDGLVYQDIVAETLSFLIAQRVAADMLTKAGYRGFSQLNVLLAGKSRDGKSYTAERMAPLVNYIVQDLGITHSVEKVVVTNNKIMDDLIGIPTAERASIYYTAQMLFNLKMGWELFGFYPIGVIDEFNRSEHVANEIVAITDNLESRVKVMGSSPVLSISTADWPYTFILTGNMTEGYGESAVPYSTLNTAVLFRMHAVILYNVASKTSKSIAKEITRYKFHKGISKDKRRLVDLVENYRENIREIKDDLEGIMEDAVEKLLMYLDKYEENVVNEAIEITTNNIGTDSEVLIRRENQFSTGLISSSNDAFVRSLTAAYLLKMNINRVAKELITWHMLHSLINPNLEEQPISAKNPAIRNKTDIRPYNEIIG